MLDEPALLAKLRLLAELMEEPGKPGEAHFAWLETATEGPRAVYGHVQIGGGHLRLEAQSRTRLQLGRGLLEIYAAHLLKHQGDAYQSLDEIKRQMAASGEPRKARQADPGGTRTRNDTPDEGPTLRQVARRPAPRVGRKNRAPGGQNQSGRKAVLDLIRDMEHHEARGAKEGDLAFDFTPLRKTLGLEGE